jgi:hypothetical protein
MLFLSDVCAGLAWVITSKLEDVGWLAGWLAGIRSNIPDEMMMVYDGDVCVVCLLAADVHTIQPFPSATAVAGAGQRHVTAPSLTRSHRGCLCSSVGVFYFPFVYFPSSC